MYSLQPTGPVRKTAHQAWASLKYENFAPLSIVQNHKSPQSNSSTPGHQQ